MRLNWTIKLHVHNHYCGNSCGKIGELSLDITIRHWECLKWPSFFFNYTLMLICCGIHSADICINTTISHWWLPFMVLSTRGSGQLSARSTIHSPAVWIYFYLCIYCIFISLSPYFIIWVCGLHCLATHDKACYCKNLLVNGGRMSIRAETCSSGWFEECVRVQTRITRLRLNIKKANGKKPLLPIN